MLQLILKISLVPVTNSAIRYEVMQLDPMSTKGRVTCDIPETVANKTTALKSMPTTGTELDCMRAGVGYVHMSGITAPATSTAVAAAVRDTSTSKTLFKSEYF